MRKFRSLRAALLTLAICCPIGASGAGFDYTYILGDSLSDQRNLFIATESLIGVGIPRADHYWQGRFSNGKNYVDVLSERMGIVTNASLLGGNNFADGGARTDYNIVEADSTKPFPVNLLGQGGALPENAFPWTLDSQRAAFTARGVYDPDGLYIVFAGANDLSDLITMVAIHSKYPLLFPDPQPALVMGKVLQSINNTIAAFVTAGARNIMVPNVPNLGVIPAVTSNGPAFAGLAAAMTAQYNAALNTMLSGWEATGLVNIIPFNTYSLLTNLVNNPAAYGFSNATTPCYTGFVGPTQPGSECAAPGSYVFWDIEHPTTAAHGLLADRMRAAIVQDILEDLSMKVNIHAVIPTGVKTSLDARLKEVQQALTDNNTANDGAAAKSLTSFINAVKALTGNKIPDDTANYLIGQAEKVVPLIARGD